MIDDSHPPVTESEGCRVVRGSIAAGVELDPIDPADEGASDYAGPLLSDLDFGAFSHSALVRLADEVCLQMHLLDLGFRYGLARRLPDEDVQRIARRQLIGIAGLAADRLRAALELPGTTPGTSGCWTCTRCSTPRRTPRPGGVADGGWLSLRRRPGRGRRDQQPRPGSPRPTRWP